jgi:hypothetical protein
MTAQTPPPKPRNRPTAERGSPNQFVTGSNSNALLAGEVEKKIHNGGRNGRAD